MKPRIKLVLFSYAMLCLAGGISMVTPEASMLCGVANGESLGTKDTVLSCDCIKARMDYPDLMVER